jgi:hypothetical protein
MLPSYIGNRDPGPRGLLHDPKLLVDGIPSTTLKTRINLNSFCIRRHSRMTRLTPSSYLRQHCPVANPMQARADSSEASPQNTGSMRHLPVIKETLYASDRRSQPTIQQL